MCEDAVVSTGRIVSRSRAERVGFFGATFGALIAANVAERFDGAPIALWDPAFEGRLYFRDLTRAQRILAMKQGRRSGPSPTVPNGPLIPAVGHSIGRELYESALSHSLVDDVGDVPRPILLLMFGERRAGSPSEHIAQSWRGRGFAVHDRYIAGREAWWFTAGSEVEAETRDDALTVTAQWLVDALQPET
jgi:hypothetical protein